MAIEVFPDSPIVGMSPRISFSHDLSQSDVVPVEQYIRTNSSSSSSSAIDFDFCVFRESFDSSTADELFFDGKILPIEIKRRLYPPRRVDDEPPPTQPVPPPPAPHQKQKSSTLPNSEAEEKHRSFWRFKRSTSLNCGSGYGRTFCPLPPLLSRSNSTGSNSGTKRSLLSNNQKQKQKQAQSAYSSRPPLKKNSGSGYYGNGIKFNPVLNVPPANLFGLGSIFSGGKDRSKKKS